MALRPAALGHLLTGSLNRRLALNLFAFSIIGLAAILLLLGTVIESRFSRLEAQEIEGHVERSDAMLRRFEQTALTRVLDWAIWDDSFNYLAAPNRAYEDGNLNLASMQNIEVSALSLSRFDGSFAKTIFYDLRADAFDAPAAAAFERQMTDPDFFRRIRARPRMTGYMRLGDRIFVIAAAQVFRSDESGVPQGYLVMGKQIRDEDIVQALQLPASIYPSTNRDKAAITRTDTQVTMRRPVAGIDGAPVAVVRFAAPRSLHREGVHLLWLTVGGVAVLLVSLILLLNRRLRAVLIEPVAAFQAHVSYISQSGELIPFADAARNDELGALYREFNAMTCELENLRAKVEAQSFAIGKSDMAVDIMHNVGNAISPVQAILGKLDQRLVFPSEQHVLRALDELAEPATAPERHAALVTFLRAAVDKLRLDLAQFRSDVREGLRSLGHVTDAIIGAQSDTHPHDAALATCELAAVVGTSSTIARHNRAADIAVAFDTDERYRIALPRLLLAQIIDNLLTNAVEAIAATGRASGAIRIEAARDARDPEHFVLVRIHDDGDGFSASAKARLFERGRTGRKKERGGVGLHWCANTLNAYGGEISLDSEGPGCGATAQIRLPLVPAAREVLPAARNEEAA